MKEFISRIVTGAVLTEEEALSAFKVITTGQATTAQIGAFLTALRMRGETTEELTGAAKAMLESITAVKIPGDAIDTCGTGGDLKGTYNISTITAFILAGCGVPVAKYGNRSSSSSSGSADVLEALGVNINAEPALVYKTLVESNICFMYAKRYCSAMHHVATVRKELGIRTIFNLLGPLLNPARVPYQITGVFSTDWLLPLAETLGHLGAKRAWVVHGRDGLDEITTTTVTDVVEYYEGRVHVFTITPSEVGLATVTLADLQGRDAVYNASAIRAVLDGVKNPLRDIALINAAAGLVISGKVLSLKDGVKQAAVAVDSGRARVALQKLVTLTNIPYIPTCPA